MHRTSNFLQRLMNAHFELWICCCCCCCQICYGVFFFPLDTLEKACVMFMYIFFVVVVVERMNKHETHSIDLDKSKNSVSFSIRFWSRLLHRDELLHFHYIVIERGRKRNTMLKHSQKVKMRARDSSWLDSTLVWPKPKSTRATFTYSVSSFFLTIERTLTISLHLHLIQQRLFCKRTVVQTTVMKLFAIQTDQRFCPLFLTLSVLLHFSACAFFFFSREKNTATTIDHFWLVLLKDVVLLISIRIAWTAKTIWTRTFSYCFRPDGTLLFGALKEKKKEKKFAERTIFAHQVTSIE